MVDEKLITIDERDVNSGRVMEMTAPFIFDEGMQISVPLNYHALIIVEDEVVKSLRVCIKKKLARVIPNEHLGKKMRVLYVSNRPFTAMSWGIGSLAITYKFLDGAKINVGASGTLVAGLDDPYAFYQYFDKAQGTVNLTECASAITAGFRKCASQVLVQMFEEADQPIFYTDFMVDEFNRRINKRFCSIRIDCVVPGIIFKNATVAGIRVNEEDKIALTSKFGNKKKK